MSKKDTLMKTKPIIAILLTLAFLISAMAAIVPIAYAEPTGQIVSNTLPTQLQAGAEIQGVVRVQNIGNTSGVFKCDFHTMWDDVWVAGPTVTVDAGVTYDAIPYVVSIFMPNQDAIIQLLVRHQNTDGTWTYDQRTEHTITLLTAPPVTAPLPPPPSPPTPKHGPWYNTGYKVIIETANNITGMLGSAIIAGEEVVVAGEASDYNGDGVVDVADVNEMFVDAGVLSRSNFTFDPNTARQLLNQLEGYYGADLQRYPTLEGRIWLLYMLAYKPYL
jgi:hypothetical protein